MSDHPDLTFGIELEFICITDPASFSEFRLGAAGPSRAGSAIFAGFREIGIPVTGFESEDEELGPVPEYSLWRVESDLCSLSKAELEACPSHCAVETVELSSRKLHFFGDDWRAEIQAVLDVLAQLEAKGARFLTNATTGMHVHVGLGGPEGKMPLRTAKNVMLIATAFERCFDQLHSTDRITYPVHFEHDWFHTPLSWWHLHNGKTAAGAMLYDWLASIEDQQSYTQLGSICTISEAHRQRLICDGASLEHACGHNSTHNFDNLDDHDSRGTNTIEFRQHTGCLDFVEISAWVLTVCQMVLYSHSASDVEMLALCARSLDLDFTIYDLLTAVGCHQDINDHYLSPSDCQTLGLLRKQSFHHVHTCDFSALDACNDDESTDRADPIANFVTAEQKHYGFDASINVIKLPSNALNILYQRAYQAITTADPNASREGVTSRARSAVFGLLAKIYRGEAWDYVQMCETQRLPIICIASIEEVMKGDFGNYGKSRSDAVEGLECDNGERTVVASL